jgi:thioredoxin reductase
MKLQVQVEHNTYLESHEVAAYGADEVIVATGSNPDGNGFQRAMPEFDALPGIENGHVTSAEDVMAKSARVGRTVLFLDETANWKGSGTALHLAQNGHKVILVTPAASVMVEMARTNADVQMRQHLRALGVEMHTETMVQHWTGSGAMLKSFGGESFAVKADTLVIAATNTPEDSIARALGLDGIGDAVAARNAAMAIYEGRKRGMAL